MASTTRNTSKAKHTPAPASKAATHASVSPPACHKIESTHRLHTQDACCHNTEGQLDQSTCAATCVQQQQEGTSRQPPPNPHKASPQLVPRSRASKHQTHPRSTLWNDAPAKGASKRNRALPPVLDSLQAPVQSTTKEGNAHKSLSNPRPSVSTGVQAKAPT